MNITVHIDQITVEGAPLTRRERGHLAAMLEQELTRLLREQVAGRRGLRPAEGQPGWGPASSVGDDRKAGSTLGSRIAREVLAALPAGTFGRRPGPVPPRAAR
jgi:hypothetical protein